MSDMRPPPMTDLPSSPAAERNKQPILETVREMLGDSGIALEIASGTGQHVVWFAAALENWVWQPTEADGCMLPVIARRIAQSGLSNLRTPLLLDVLAAQWPTPAAPVEEPFDAIFCANMLHISPPSAVAALMLGAGRHLKPGGLLITYGPYLEDGPIAPGNLTFDTDLRQRNPAWGIRKLDDVVHKASRKGLQLQQRRQMPANNLLLFFRYDGT